MKNIALVFPGVGSQYTGMGKSFYDKFKVVQDAFEEASDTTALHLADLCFSPQQEKQLSRLEYSQLALLTISTAAYRLLQQEVGIPAQYALGHSLGEISALCCAGIIRFSDALSIVQQRGVLINETIAALDGTMAWVINLEGALVEAICRTYSSEGKAVFVSAYDSPNQTSISGHTPAIMEVARKLEEAGAIVYPLKMSGPFHSPLMQEAAERMEAVVARLEYGTASFPVIANQHALPYTDKQSVVENLSLQLIRPVRWRPCLEYVIAQGVNTAIEVGPKNVLKFLIEKNTDRIATFSLDTLKDLEMAKREFVVDQEGYLAIVAKCLKIAVSTKNWNENNEEYRQGVILPYKKLEHFYQTLITEKKYPTEKQVKESMEVAKAILVTKKVPLPEQQYRLNQLLEGKVFASVSG